MIFVRDNGVEAIQSQIDLDRPYVPRYDYMKAFAGAFMIRPQQERVLIVGLGGGGVIHFFRRFSPQTQIDVVEIDPEVIRLADQWFGVRSGEGVRIIEADGVKFLANVRVPYDTIFLDAYLKPSDATNVTGAPLAMRTQQFYREMHAALKPGGLVVFNVNIYDGIVQDLRNIIASFPQTYMFPLTGEVMAVGSLQADRLDDATLQREADRLDRRLNEPWMNFREVEQRLYRAPKPAAP